MYRIGLKHTDDLAVSRGKITQEGVTYLRVQKSLIKMPISQRHYFRSKTIFTNILIGLATK